MQSSWWRWNGLLLFRMLFFRFKTVLTFCLVKIIWWEKFTIPLHWHFCDQFTVYVMLWSYNLLLFVDSKFMQRWITIIIFFFVTVLDSSPRAKVGTQTVYFYFSLLSTHSNTASNTTSILQKRWSSKLCYSLGNHRDNQATNSTII